MIVKSEEATLPHCLDSAKNLADEIIIVDTGSTDRTVSIAESYGTRVFFFDFETVDFAAARNYAISKATGEWILVLDADEHLDPTTAPLIHQLIALYENAGYYFQRRNHSANEATIDHVVRLFRNREGIRYQGRVHETVDQAILSTGGRLRRTGIFIDHAFSSDQAERRRKNHWYIKILKEEIEVDPVNISRLEFLAAEYHQSK